MQRPLVVSAGLFSVFLVDKVHGDVASADDGLDEERVERQRRRVTLQSLVQLFQTMITKGQTVKESVVARVLGHGLAEVVEGVAVIGGF